MLIVSFQGLLCTVILTFGLGAAAGILIGGIIVSRHYNKK